MTCENCEYFYECEGGCRFQNVTPDDEEEEEDYTPSAEDYAEWCGKGWLYK